MNHQPFAGRNQGPPRPCLQVSITDAKQGVGSWPLRMARPTWPSQRLLDNRSSRLLSSYCMRTVSLWASSWLQALRSPPTASFGERWRVWEAELWILYEEDHWWLLRRVKLCLQGPWKTRLQGWCGSFHPSFSSAGSCHTKAMVMKTRKKITTGIESLTSSPWERLHRPSKPAFLLHLSSDPGAYGRNSFLGECREQGVHLRLQPTFVRNLLLSSPKPNLTVSSKIKWQLALSPHLPRCCFNVSHGSVYTYSPHV